MARLLMLASCLNAAVVGGCGFAPTNFLRNTPSIENVADNALLACIGGASEAWLANSTFNRRARGEPTAEILLSSCGVQVDRNDQGWIVNYFPGRDRVGGGYSATQSAMKETGCLGDLDLVKLSQTRPIDGRVLSGDGKTSWVYSASSGLTIICER